MNLLQAFFCFLFLLLLAAVFIFFGGSGKPVADCNSFDYYVCPSSCVVCPPCAVCSSIACRTEEFCNSIGFDRNWYKTVSVGRNS